MDKKNFLVETLESMQEINKTEHDVVWAGSVDGEYSISFEDFKKQAGFEYDAGLGGDEILPTLVIVFKDGSWLERDEFNGSSWWEYKHTPQLSEAPQSFRISTDRHRLEPVAV